MNPDFLNHLAQDFLEKGYTFTAKDLRDAASEIEKLRFENVKLKIALSMKERAEAC